MCYRLHLEFRCGHHDHGRLCRYVTNATTADCGRHPRSSSGASLPPVAVSLAASDCLPCATIVFDRGLEARWTEAVEAKEAAWVRVRASADPPAVDNWLRACSEFGGVQAWVMVQQREFRERYNWSLYEEALSRVDAMPGLKGDRMCYHLHIAFRCGHFDHGRLCWYITNATTADCGQHPRTSSGDPLPPIGVHLAAYDCLPCAMIAYNRRFVVLWRETVEAKKAAWARFRASADPQMASNWTQACSHLEYVQGWVMVKQMEFRESHIWWLHEVARRQVEARHGLTGVLKMGTGCDTN
ncbi:MAG: hypothetical protein M1826_000859 [Phylliscum demangeonii]|nr:MAG: hypothetical protein M1826_000859 [Phylliscum demangeonii]